MAKIPYHSSTETVDALSGGTGWVPSLGTLLASIQTDGGEDLSTSIADSSFTVSFADTTISSSSMCIGVSLNIKYKGNGLTVEVDNPSGTYPASQQIPRNQTLPDNGSEYDTFEIFLQHRPLHTFFDDDQAWDDLDGNVADINDFTFTFTGASGSCTIDHIFLKVYERQTVTREELSGATGYDFVQCMQIEGVPYIFTDKPLTDISGNSDHTWLDSYGYFGVQHRVVNGVMKTLARLYGGRINFSSGKVEEEGGSVSLIDTDRVWFERDLESSYDKSETYYQRGFISWLLSSGDRTNFGNSLMANSSAYNTITGLQPDDGAIYGREFVVTSNTELGFDESSGDEYVYINRECIFVGQTTSNDMENLGRGQFGSLNNVHRFDPVTGLGPLVSKHPYTWNDRWVRIWSIPLDQQTGFPLPVRTTWCQTLTWGGHEQSIGYGQNEWTINLQPFSRLLDRQIIGADPVSLQRITFSENTVSDYFAILGDFAGTGNDLSAAVVLSAKAYKDVNEILNEIKNSLSTTLSWLAPFIRIDLSPDGYVTVYSVFEGDEAVISIEMSAELAMVLGFQDNAEAFYGGKGTTVSANESRLVAENKPMSVFVGSLAKRLRFSTDQVDTPRAWESIGFQKQWVSGGLSYTPIRVGASDPIFIDVTNSLATTSAATDSLGNYVGDMSNVGVARWLSDKKLYGIGTREGEPGPIAYPVCYHKDISFHEAALAHMTSVGYAQNGTYDALPPGQGLGIREELIDVAKWETLGSKFDKMGKRTYVLTERMKFSDLINDEFKMPIGITLGQDPLGRITLIPSSLSVARPDKFTTITNENIIRGSSSTVKVTQEGIYNTIIMKMDWDDKEEKFKKTVTATEPNSIARYGSRPIKIESKHLRSSNFDTSQSVYSAFVGYARSFFNQWAFEVPEVTLQITNKGNTLKPGDLIRLTATELCDIVDSSADGIVDKPCIVVSADKDIVQGVTSVRLVYDRVFANIGGWAPSLQLGVISSSSTTVSAVKQQFCPTAAISGYPQLEINDLNYFSSEDAVVIIEPGNSTPSTLANFVSSVDPVAGTITFNTTVPTTYSQGYVIFADYATVGSGQKDDNYVFNGQDFTMAR